MYENYIISAKGSQQGDPLDGLEFCESIQPTLLEWEARTTMGHDINLKGEVFSVAREVQAMIDYNTTTGFALNAGKCEITAKKVEMIDNYCKSRCCRPDTIECTDPRRKSW